jgi:hypothetical protein
LSNSGSQPLVTHVFKQPGEYQPLIKVSDQAGNVAILQLYAPVTGESTDVDPTPTSNIPFSAVLVFLPPVIGASIIMVFGLRKLLLYIISKLI